MNVWNFLNPVRQFNRTPVSAFPWTGIFGLLAIVFLPLFFYGSLNRYSIFDIPLGFLFAGLLVPVFVSFLILYNRYARRRQDVQSEGQDLPW